MMSISASSYTNRREKLLPYVASPFAEACKFRRKRKKILELPTAPGEEGRPWGGSPNRKTAAAFACFVWSRAKAARNALAPKQKAALGAAALRAAEVIPKGGCGRYPAPPGFFRGRAQAGARWSCRGALRRSAPARWSRCSS